MKNIMSYKNLSNVLSFNSFDEARSYFLQNSDSYFLSNDCNEAYTTAIINDRIFDVIIYAEVNQVKITEVKFKYVSDREYETRILLKAENEVKRKNKELYKLLQF